MKLPTHYRRAILIGFGGLDAVLLVRFPPQNTWPGYVFDDAIFFPFRALMVCESLFLVSLAFSALGLMLARKWAIVLSYVQFPIRFAFLYLSFGFLCLLARVPLFLDFYHALVITAIVLECIRMGVTIVIHRELVRWDPQK